MSELQRAIEEITYTSRKFPAKAFNVISADKGGAIPYLRSAIEKAIQEKDELDEDYQLHFYALFLLGEFEDREFFDKILEFVSLPQELLEFLIGDAVTSGLKDVVYQTYNGDIELLKTTIRNESVGEYVRGELLQVMGQLYLDGILEEKEWRAFLKENIYSEEEYSYFYDALASVICKCHFADMLSDIRYLYDHDLLDTMYLGKYDSCVDYMFKYQDYEKNFCEPKMKAADMLKSWAMFQEDTKPIDDKQFAEGLEKLVKDVMKPEAVRKVGRNEPCPCGSGKKYKFCCLNKVQSPLDKIESIQEREKCLKRYPYIGNERQKDKVYLEDYFDRESIEIDKLLYLGLMHRPGLIWLNDTNKEEIRCREYLSLAFGMFIEKVKKEGIKSFKEYDQKFSIHYLCEEWMNELLRLLKKNGNKELYAEVEEKFLYLTEN